MMDFLFKVLDTNKPSCVQFNVSIINLFCEVIHKKLVNSCIMFINQSSNESQFWLWLIADNLVGVRCVICTYIFSARSDIFNQCLNLLRINYIDIDDALYRCYTYEKICRCFHSFSHTQTPRTHIRVLELCIIAARFLVLV